MVAGQGAVTEATTVELAAHSFAGLLVLHSRIAEELRDRGITRTSNNPTGDLAEYLFCKAFGWRQEANSKSNVDAVCSDGNRYQIKGRRITRHNNSRQLSAIRDLASGHFDFLAGVVFNESYAVLRAAIIPPSLLHERATFVARTNSHKFILRDDVWNQPGVRDVTDRVRAVVV
jgi:hypothetical protein